MDIARSVQEVTEEIVLRMARHAREITGKSNLCLAGGVALNCVANGKLLRERIFEDIWIQPAAGDAGGAVGAALAVWHNVLGHPRERDGRRDTMKGAYLGPEFSPEQLRTYLDANDYPCEELSDEDWAPRIAALVADANVIGLLHGRMEFGPRALGNRSIIGDPRSAEMQSVLNLKIKFRESFRPFAPSCLEERAAEYFDLDRPSPYMLLVADVCKERCTEPRGDEHQLDLREWVNRPRSDLPAITHVDYSARIQTVSEETNPRYHAVKGGWQPPARRADSARQTGAGWRLRRRSSPRWSARRPAPASATTATTSSRQPSPAAATATRSSNSHLSSLRARCTSSWVMTTSSVELFQSRQSPGSTTVATPRLLEHGARPVRKRTSRR